MDNMLCPKDVTLLTALQRINDNAMGIVFVVDDQQQLCGTLTDGDIRRALLRDVALDASVASILSDSYISARQGESVEALLQKVSKRVKVIPLVDERGRVVDFFEYKQDLHFPVAIPNLSGNEFKYLTDAFMSSWISSSGEYINRFETAFASYSDAAHGVATSSGTTALHLALLALDIGEGDEVIVPDLTFAATINAVLHANATPVIVDVDPQSWCIDPRAIEAAITTKIKAIIPVHLYGQPCDMDAIMELARIHDLKVIEDCAEAHGARWRGRRVGSFGDIGCFSFFGNKVITTGEGGICTTAEEAVAERLRMLRDHGMSRTKRYWHEVVGYNYRMTNLQAAIGLAQLERIESIHQNRREYEQGYRAVLPEDRFSFQQDRAGAQRITWLVSVLLRDPATRDECMQELQAGGIDVRPFFYPLSAMPPYKQFARQPTPVAADLSARGLSLPTYESLKSVGEIKVLLEELL